MKVFLILAGGFAAFIWGALQLHNSEWMQNVQRQREAQRAADAKPRKVNEADGCTVYAFKPADRWLYFTRCPNSQVTTNNAWEVSERSGKTTTTRTETMDIKTGE